MKIAITGINGFIGSCLLKKLKMKYECVAMSTHPFDVNIVPLKDGMPAYNAFDINVLIHCGGILPGAYTADQYYYSNVLCTRNIIAWAEKMGIEHVIFISSGAVYGENEQARIESDTIRPDNLYAFSKWSGENETRYSLIPVKTILRLYFPIGNMCYNHLFSRLASKILNNETIYLNSKGFPFISPIAIDDVIECIDSIIINKVSGVFNLSANEIVSIKDIVHKIMNKCGRYTNIVCNNKEVLNYIGNSSKLSKSIGKENFLSVDKAIDMMLNNRLQG